MQLMPGTGDQMKVGDIHQKEANIHAGVKYIRFMVDKYFANEPMDDTNKLLFAFAAYNAGPGRIHSLREEAAKKGLDPNVWIGSVELSPQQESEWRRSHTSQISTNITSPTNWWPSKKKKGKKSGNRCKTSHCSSRALKQRVFHHAHLQDDSGWAPAEPFT